MLTDHESKLVDDVSKVLASGIPMDGAMGLAFYRIALRVKNAPRAVCEPCVGRRKIILTVMGTVKEDACGIKDSAIADFIDFNIKSPCGSPVVRANFCPWCGGTIDPSRGLVVTSTKKMPDPS